MFAAEIYAAVNYLQSCATLDEEITQEMVYKITGKIHPSEIQEMIMTALNRELGTSMTKLDSFMQEYGLSGRNIVSQMHQEIYNLNISERKKLEIIKILAEIEYRLSQGGTEEVQLNAMLAKISMLNF